jgi:predicted DNA-binding protein YlxM (UPF0122 family)
MSGSVSKRLLAEMTDEEREKYHRRCDIAAELHLKQKAIYESFNPAINRLLYEKKMQLDALYEWRNSLYEKEGL